MREEMKIEDARGMYTHLKLPSILRIEDHKSLLNGRHFRYVGNGYKNI